ncbi:MAG: ABC transporter permease [Pseudomonadota bacterium]
MVIEEAIASNRREIKTKVKRRPRLQGFKMLLKSANLFQKLLEKRTRRFVLNPGISMLILSMVVLCAIFAPQIAPHDPNMSKLEQQFIVPAWMPGGSSDHLLGTDYFGRDVLSRLIYGTRVSILVAASAILISACFGTLLGLISGYYGGFADTIIMRITDSMWSIPWLVVAIVIAVSLGASLQNTIFVLAFFGWPMYARQIRAISLVIKERDYVALARVAGASTFRMLSKHFVPNIIPTFLVLATLDVGNIILAEATLSFLGVGVPPPTASWGSMCSEGQGYIATLWWLPLFPGIAIFITVMAANILGDWVRDYLDPKLRQL